MCNINQNSQLDEQRLLYMYQGLNIVFKLLSQHLDATHQPIDTLAEAYKKADAGSIVGMAAMALKNGNITQSQYQTIFDTAMDMKTVDAQAWTVPNEVYRLLGGK